MADIFNELREINERLSAIQNREGDQWMDLTALSKHGCIGKTTLRSLIKNGELPACRAGGKILVRKSAFDSWLSRRRIEPVNIGKIVEEVMESFN